MLAQRYGGIALILYSDPEDYVPEGGLPYPNGQWMPDTGVQRGSIFYDAGDPLTPHYPATGMWISVARLICEGKRNLFSMKARSDENDLYLLLKNYQIQAVPKNINTIWQVSLTVVQKKNHMTLH